MRRREFIAGLGGAAAWPLVARAQQGERIRRVGMLNPSDENSPETKTNLLLFMQGLEELGWVEGGNLRIERRWAGGNVERMRMLARELVDLKPDVIVVSSGVATKAVQQATRTIPIVFVYAGDPVANGMVANIGRPEGNTTGVTDLFPSIGSKWLELLKEAVPNLARVALIFNPDLINVGSAGAVTTLTAVEEAAVRYGVKAMRSAVRTGDEIVPALDAFAAEPNGGVIPLPPLGVLPRAIELINQAGLRHRLPTIHSARAGAAGGLMSYGAIIPDLFRHGGPDYVNRILRGAKPNELPVQFSTRFELVLNLKTAKAIGIEFPPQILGLADAVIE
jgi:putative tryptophan/tyrosine transport system substrate-binding protein